MILDRPFRCWLFALVLGITGCAAPAHRTSREPLDVPFFAQEPGQCGPAALAMVIDYYGGRSLHVTPHDIAGSIYFPQIHGALTTDLEDCARKFNLWVRQYHGSSADLRQKLAAGVPLIVLGRFGAQYHYFVVLGVDDFRQIVTAHSDTRPDVEFSQDEFRRFWDRADRWTLLVCPPEFASSPLRRATWTLSADERNDLGLFWERMGRLSVAAANYREATELQPANSFFQMNLGNALLKQRLFSEAAAAYTHAVRLDPKNADAMNNLAYAYAELGANLDQAVQLCQRAVALHPSHRAYYLDTLGSVLLKEGKTGEAVAAFESAIAAATEHQSALHAGIQKRLAAARAAAVKNNE